MYKNLLLITLLTGSLFDVFTVRATTLPSVTINEIMWMGSSGSSSDEWIELKNTTDVPVTLDGWSLKKLSSGSLVPMVTIPSGTIPAHGFFVIANDPETTSRLAIHPDVVDSAMSLVNSKLQIGLFDQSSVQMDLADDGVGNPAAGDYTSGSVWKSMERNPSGFDGTKPESWHTASTSTNFDDATKEFGTPGADNSNSAPTIHATIPDAATVNTTVQFDATESTDAENDPLTFAWSFGDGITSDGPTATHIYTSSGMFTAHLVVSDSALQSAQDVVMTIQPALSLQTVVDDPTLPPATPSTPSPSNTTAHVLLNELFPNPSGVDTNHEYIELVNQESFVVDLTGWKITIGTHSYTLSASSISAKKFLVLSDAITHLHLPNTTATVTLFHPDGSVADRIAYTRTMENQSFGRFGTIWKWSTPTSGKENAESKPVSSAKSPAKKTTAAKTSTTKKTTTAKKTTVPSFKRFSIAQALAQKRLTKVELRGVVTAPPGILAADTFVLADSSGALPVHAIGADVGVGDAVTVQGSMGSSNGEKKLNAASDETAVQVTGDATLPSPVSSSSTTPTGTLVTVTGTVAAKRATSLSITTDDATYSIPIKADADLDVSDVQPKSPITITGILRITSTGKRIYPRSQDDIVVHKGTIAGASTDTPSQPTTLQPEKSTFPWTYLALPVLAAAGIWWYKRRKRIATDA